MSSRTHASKKRGQALVEFALVLPLFVLMVFGIVDAGRLIYTYNTVANAARDGARVAIVNQSVSGTNTCDTTSATAYAVGCAIVSGAGLGLTTAAVSVAYAASSDPTNATPSAVLSIGCIAIVRVTGQYQPLTPVIGQLIGQVSLSSTAEIPVERVCSNPPPSPLINC